MYLYVEKTYVHAHMYTSHTIVDMRPHICMYVHTHTCVCALRVYVSTCTYKYVYTALICICVCVFVCIFLCHMPCLTMYIYIYGVKIQHGLQHTQHFCAWIKALSLSTVRAQHTKRCVDTTGCNFSW